MTLTEAEVEILKRNIWETQKELNAAYKRIAELVDRNTELSEQVIALQREQSVNLGRS